MIVQLLKPYSPKKGETIPVTVNNQPTVVDLPDDEARALINRYGAKLTHKGEVNWPEQKAPAKAKA